MHITFRQKATIYFTLGFVVLWTICSLVLFFQFRKALWHSFDEEMEIRASIVAERTGIDPRIIPLPQKEENYMILYENDYGIDTLFSPTLSGFSFQDQRFVEYREDREEGVLTIYYTTPSTEIDNAIEQVTAAILLMLLIGVVVSGLLGYWLSGKVVKPLHQIMTRANQTDIFQNTQLLEEPAGKDELQQLIVSFNRMLLRIKEQTGQQNAFFASASHELRTPLSIMQTRLQVLLQDNSIPEETRRAYRDQLLDVQRMIRMVNDFLLMSELQNNSMPLVIDDCDIVELTMDVLDIYQHKARERNLKFKINLFPENTIYTVKADVEKLRIIFRNLIENVLKYAQENSMIEIVLQKEDKINFTIRNPVREDIHPDIESVTSPHYHSKPLDGEGSGLGLWISSRLADIQGFELRVRLIRDTVFEARLIMES